MGIIRFQFESVTVDPGVIVTVETSECSLTLSLPPLVAGGGARVPSALSGHLYMKVSHFVKRYGTSLEHTHHPLLAKPYVCYCMIFPNLRMFEHTVVGAYDSIGLLINIGCVNQLLPSYYEKQALLVYVLYTWGIRNLGPFIWWRIMAIVIL